jgi:multidrug efflux pump subunit AcrA (membrane-fusion protein)
MRLPARQAQDGQFGSAPDAPDPARDDHHVIGPDGQLIAAEGAPAQPDWQPLEPAPEPQRTGRRLPARRIARGIRRRPWLSALVALVVLAAGGGLFWWTGRDSTANAAPSYRLVAASLGTIRQTLSSTGTIEPAVQDSLDFAVSGQVTSVRVVAGQKVAAGAVLATVNSAALKANLAQAQASLASAQARVSADSSASSTQLAADNAAVTAVQGQVAAAQAALADADLTSPIAGVVASVNLVVGQQVSGSSGSGNSTGSNGSAGNGSTGGFGNTGSTGSSTSSSGSSAQVLVISDNAWIVNAAVDDTQVGLLAVGDQAQITGATASGLVYGTVSSVGLIASSTSGVASYPVTIKVTGNPAGLHAGATATVTMIYRQLSNVLTVPSTAVHQVNGQSVVYELSGGKQVAHPVTVGLSAGGSSQITAGLAEGTQVVVEVPRAATNRTGGTTNNRTGFGRTGGFGGGFGGGGFGGGGLGGGGFGGDGFGGGAGRGGGTGGAGGTGTVRGGSGGG